MSCFDVMTSRCKSVELNQNLSTVSFEWDLDHVKMSFIMRAVIFSYKINVILCHNGDQGGLDYYVMTSFFLVDFRQFL